MLSWSFCVQKKPCSKSYTLCHVNFQDFSRTTGKQEPTSGLASQQLSRLPSDEHLCLSPPWNEEDDGPVGVSYILLFTIWHWHLQYKSFLVHSCVLILFSINLYWNLPWTFRCFNSFQFTGIQVTIIVIVLSIM